MNRNSLGIPHGPAWQKRDGIRGPLRHILEADNPLRPGQRGIEGKDTKEGEPNNDTEDGDEKDERAESHEDIEDTDEEEDGDDGDEGQDSDEEHYDYDEDEDKGDGAIANYYNPGDLERQGAEAKSPAKQPEPGPSSKATTKNDPPSTSASDRKILAKKHITISDDRSVGSEFEVTRRDLLALKPREYKLQLSSTLQSIPQQPSSSSNPTSTLQPTASTSIGSTSPGPNTDGIEPNNLTAQQFQVPAGANATAQARLYQANLAQQQATQMPGSKGMPNPGGPPNQGFPMMNQGQDGGAIANYYDPGEMGPNGMRGPGGQPGAAGGNHALQDYQMHSMLLEQQNKKRLMMARQEQEEMTIPGGGYDIDIPTKQIPKPTMEVGSLRNGITANRHVGNKTGIFIQPKLHLISLENPDHLVEAAMQSRMQDFERALREQAEVGSSNKVTPDLPFLPQSSTSQVTPALQLQGYASTEDLDQNSHLDNLSSIAAGILGIPNASAVDFETLQAYVLDLQKKAETLETLRRQQEPSEFQIIHRVPQLHQRKTIQLYFDAPQWSGGEGNSRALRSSLPISSLTSYLDKHPELVFVVYRDYDVAAMARDDTENKDGDVMPQVKHTGESLHPTTKALIAAVRIFLKSNQYFSNVATGFQNSELLEAPYLVIYHTRKEMGNFLHTLPEQQQRQFQLLLDYILSDYHDDYATVDALLDRGKITYPYIKYLFKPGDILVEGKDDNIRGVFSKSWLENKAIDRQSQRDKSTKNGESIQCWEIETWSWEFTGVFSRMNYKLLLKLDANDPSEKTIADLSLRPLAFMSDGLKALLKRRGETIWKCRIRHFVSYHKEKGREFHHSGDDRYMIDLKTYRELHKSDRSKFKFMDEAPPDDLGEEAMEKDSPPDATFLYLVPPTIKGYNLKRKKWLELQVDRIAEVVWNKEAFQSLVLDRKTKGLIEALISNQLDAEKSTDLISGKGNGLILLLHGGPGTGKTLTAESVAEIAEKPLYPVTCGDIGTVPDEVEDYLESVLNLGKTWQCVVLLDEADVFLEQRSLEDLRRNALVSVFLRVLEYYDGILVLTSNRVGIFDEAFKSRIQLALHYANLSAYQRVKIWQNFIERLEKLKEENVDFDDLKDHLEQLAENKMNGRQIRNAITTARQYAKWKGESLNYALMKDIIETAGRFDVYIEKLNGGYSQDQLAEDEGLRLSGVA